MGEDACKDWGTVYGPSCNRVPNDKGLKRLDFTSCNNIVLANTLSYHKRSRRVTLYHQDGVHHNQFECILVKKRFRSGIGFARMRTFLGADVGRDHDM